MFEFKGLSLRGVITIYSIELRNVAKMNIVGKGALAKFLVISAQELSNENDKEKKK
jgi:hypothetical protein